jgi:hypothetical protein
MPWLKRAVLCSKKYEGKTNITAFALSVLIVEDLVRKYACSSKLSSV